LGLKVPKNSGVDQSDAPGRDVHQHEDVHRGKERRVLGQEVDREDLVRMVSDEAPPRRDTTRRTSPPSHPGPEYSGFSVRMGFSQITGQLPTFTRILADRHCALVLESLGIFAKKRRTCAGRIYAHDRLDGR